MNVSIQERKEIEKKDIDSEILENYIETVTKEKDEENVYEIDPVITWETLKNYRETNDCEKFNSIMDKFERINTKRFSPGFWDSKVSHKLYMFILRIKLEFYTMESLYKIKKKNLEKHYGCRLLSKYNNSPFQLLKHVYPNYEWLFWKFTIAPMNSWESKENQLKYMTWLSKILSYTTMEDWFQIKQDDFHINYGGGLLAGRYNDSPSQLLRQVYPNYEWYFWKFTQAPHKNAWDSMENQLQYMTWLGDKLRYRKKEDWYQITNRIFTDNYGSALVTNYYNSSPILLLKSIYPEYKWLFWKFTSAPNNSWDSKENQLEYINWLSQELGFTNMEDWYKITRNIFIKNYGGGLLSKYDGCVYKLLNSLLENHKWLFWKFIVAPKHCWERKEKQLEYMDWLAEELGFRKKSDWYKIKYKDFQDYNGSTLMNYYKNIYELLKSIYPTYDWFFFKFSMVNLWDEYKYQIEYIEWLGKKLGYSKLDDWYNINIEIFKDNYGSGLLSKYNSSPYQLLSSIYPEYKWLFWKFSRSPNNHWNIKENQLQYMNSLQKILGYHKIDDLYKVTKNDFEENSGIGLLSKYNNSPYQLLLSIYPEYEWFFWKFSHSPNGSWKNKENQLKYMNLLGKKLGYTTTEDWYKVTITDFHENDGGGLLCGYYNGSPYQLVSSVYPNYEWIRSKFAKQRYSKGQIQWLNFLQKYYGINIQHACNDGEYKIPETLYHADGFCRNTNTIYEYLGDYWHGNPIIFPSDDFNKARKCTYGEIYNNTCKRESEIRDLGYNLVVIWESDWKRINNAIRKLQKKYSLRKKK